MGEKGLKNYLTHTDRDTGHKDGKVEGRRDGQEGWMDKRKEWMDEGKE